MRCECRGREHTVVVYRRIGAGSRSDNGKVPLTGLFTVKIEDALTPPVPLSHCNSVKSGGPSCTLQHNPQQFHSWNQAEILV
jgi:hypothetical protein